MADGMFGEAILRVHPVRHNEKLPVIRPATMQSIAMDLQPRLLDYRLKQRPAIHAKIGCRCALGCAILHDSHFNNLFKLSSEAAH